MLGAGVCFSTVLSAYRYTSGVRGSNSVETDEDEVARKEEMRKVRRRPLSETIEQLGEGRGKHTTQINEFTTEHIRYLRPWIRREEATEAVGEVWNRCQGSARAELDTTPFPWSSQQYQIPILESWGIVVLCTYYLAYPALAIQLFFFCDTGKSSSLTKASSTTKMVTTIALSSAS